MNYINFIIFYHSIVGKIHVSDRKIYILMMPFSTGTVLERVGIAGPELELSLGRSAGSRHWTPLQ